jgi:hypothetical protein
MLRSSSIVYQEFNMKKLELLEMTDIMAKDVLKEYPQLKIAVQRRQLYARFSTLNQFQNVKGHKNEKKELISYIRMNKGCVLGNPKAPKSDKLCTNYKKDCKIDNKRLHINEINPYICASYNTARANNRIFL